MNPYLLKLIIPTILVSVGMTSCGGAGVERSKPPVPPVESWDKLTLQDYEYRFPGTLLKDLFTYRTPFSFGMALWLDVDLTTLNGTKYQYEFATTGADIGFKMSHDFVINQCKDLTFKVTALDYRGDYSVVETGDVIGSVDKDCIVTVDPSKTSHKQQNGSLYGIQIELVKYSIGPNPGQIANIAIRNRIKISYNGGVSIK